MRFSSRVSSHVVLMLALVAAGPVLAEESPDLTPGGAADQRPIVLVAAAGMNQPYTGAVIVIASSGDGRHLGVMLNKPAGVTLGDALASAHGASAARGLNLGGPQLANALFAVVKSDHPLDTSALPLGGDLFLVGEARTVETLMEEDSPDARYFAGLVLWDVGELDAELARGLWTVQRVETAALLGAVPRSAAPPVPSEHSEQLQDNQNTERNT